MRIARMRNALLAALALALVALPPGPARAQGLPRVGPGAPRMALERARLSAALTGNDPGDAYPVRLEAVRQLARRFPGRISPVGHQYREMGLFAGIFMQTLWQHESGRDELPIWSVVNRNLTLVPRAYMAEYEANPREPYEKSAFVRAHPTRGGARAPITQLDTCRAWKDYFKASDEARRDLSSSNPFVRLRGAFNQRTVVNRRLWRAHTTGIRYALWHHAGEFAQVAIPEEELAFWRGWIRVVYMSEKLAPSTNDLLLRPFLKLSMPPCSPLGRSGCTVEDQPALREAFIRWLMYGNVDQHEFLAVFGGRPTASSLARAGLPGRFAPGAMAVAPALAPLADDDVAAAVRSGLDPRSLALDRQDEIILDAVVARIRARR